MKSLLLAATLLPHALADVPATTPSEVDAPTSQFTPAPAATIDTLRDACRRCATIDFLYEGAPYFNESHSRESLAPLLERILQSRDGELSTRTGAEDMTAPGMRKLTLRFRDAAGRDILVLDNIFYLRHPQTPEVHCSLWNLFEDELERQRAEQHRSELRRLAEGLQAGQGIPLFLCISSFPEPGANYGQWDALPQVIGMLGADDLRALADAPLIPNDGEDTLDYWYQLDWELPEGSSELTITLCPAPEHGIAVGGSHLHHDALHAKVSAMIAAWFRRHGLEADANGTLSPCTPEPATPAPTGVEALAAILQLSLDANRSLLDNLAAFPRRPTAQDTKGFEEFMLRRFGDVRRRMVELTPAVGDDVSTKPGYDALMSSYRRQNLLLEGDIRSASERILRQHRLAPQAHVPLTRFTYKDAALLHRDTRRQMKALAGDIRDILDGYLKLLPTIVDARSARENSGLLTVWQLDYDEASRLLALYQQDDPEGAGDILQQIRQEYQDKQAQMLQEEERLRRHDCFNEPALRALFP